MKQTLDIYYQTAKTAFIVIMQYRVGFFLWIVGMVVEPVVYLIVWRTIATAQGGIVGGFTANDFAGYYLVWTLVRQMNIGLTPWAFEDRVQRGSLSPLLLHPIHPFHFDLAWFFGFKVVSTLLWVPVGAILYLIFHPTLDPTWWQIPAFIWAIIGGFMMRFILLWALGLITFWVVRISAIFDLYFAIELLLSGRLVPLELMPGWLQQLAGWLPFQWSFGFPIELLLGRLTLQQTWYGFAAQLIWSIIGSIILLILWKQGVRRYSAVGA